MASFARGNVPTGARASSVTAESRAVIALQNTGATPITLQDGWVSLTGAMEFAMAMGDGAGLDEPNVSSFWFLELDTGSGLSGGSVFDAFTFVADRAAGPTRFSDTTSADLVFRPVTTPNEVFYFAGFSGSLAAAGLTLAPDASVRVEVTVSTSFSGDRTNHAGSFGTFDPMNFGTSDPMNNAIVPLSLAMLLPAGTVFDDGGRGMSWVSVAQGADPGSMPAPIPLPPAAMMLATGLCGLGLVSRWRRRPAVSQTA